jgi:hypothetical protein
MLNKKNLSRILPIVTLVAGAVYGQYSSMTAEIPFAFRAVRTDLPAGRYSIAAAPGTVGSPANMELRNLDTGKAVFIATKDAPLTESKNGRARLIFRCGGEGCSLATLWSGTGTRVLHAGAGGITQTP